MPLTQVNDHTFMRQLVSRDSIVIDLGANHGGFSHTMANNFKCKCIAIEPNPALCKTIKPHALITVKNVAVAATSGILPFHVCKNDEASSLIRTDNNDAIETIQVPSITLRALLAQLNIESVDLLKMDIEGAEIDVLNECPDDLLCRVKQITVEFHDFNGLISRESAVGVIDRLHQLGFHVFPMWMRSHGDTLFVNRSITKLGNFDRIWSRRVVRNWWWTKRFIKRKLNLEN